MSLALVGTVATGSGDASGANIASGAKAHATGDLLVVIVVWTGAAITASIPTDTALNTYTRVTGSKQDHTNDHIETFLCANITGNAANVVNDAFAGGSPTFRRIMVFEYSGAATASAQDQVAIGAATATTSIASATMNTTQADEVIVSGYGSSGTGTAITAGGSFTLRVTGLGSDTSGEDRIVAATGAYTAGFSWTGNQDAWSSSTTYKAAGGAPTFFRPTVITSREAHRRSTRW